MFGWSLTPENAILFITSVKEIVCLPETIPRTILSKLNPAFEEDCLLGNLQQV